MNLRQSDSHICGDGMCWQKPLCDAIDDYKKEIAALKAEVRQIVTDQQAGQGLDVSRLYQLTAVKR